MSTTAARDIKKAGIENATALGAIRTENGPRRAVLHGFVRDIEDGSGDTDN